MKKVNKIIITLLLVIITVLSVIPAGAKTLNSISKNYDFHYGLDVSTWNEHLNMTKIKKADVEFAIIRIGYYKKDGGHLDVRFKENVRKCAENGIEFGVYVYSYVYKKSDNLKCAKWVHKNLKAMGNYCKNVKTIPVAYDIEDKIQEKAVKKKKISRTYLYKSVCKFSDKIKSYGYIPVVYSFQSFFEKYLNISKLQKKGYKIWYAQWPYFYHLNTRVKKVMYNDTIADIWQFTDNLTVGGKRFDVNVCYDNLYDYKYENKKIKVKNLKEVYTLGNKQSVKPSSFKVYNGSKLLKKGKDYKLAYFKNNRAGTAKLKVIRYKNKKYQDTKTFFFDVKPANPRKITVKSYLHRLEPEWEKSKGASYYEILQRDEEEYTYNLIGTSKKNSCVIDDLDSSMKYDFKIRAVYDKNEKKYYSDYKKFSGYTKYPKVEIISATSTKKKYAKVKWEKKEENCKGYEVQYSLNKEFKKPVITKTVSGIDNTSKSIKLTSGKKYYFRVRAYNTVDSQKIYSTYSDVLKVKIK